MTTFKKLQQDKKIITQLVVYKLKTTPSQGDDYTTIDY